MFIESYIKTFGENILTLIMWFSSVITPQMRSLLQQASLPTLLSWNKLVPGGITSSRVILLARQFSRPWINFKIMLRVLFTVRDHSWYGNKMSLRPESQSATFVQSVWVPSETFTLSLTLNLSWSLWFMKHAHVMMLKSKSAWLSVVLHCLFSCCGFVLPKNIQLRSQRSPLTSSISDLRESPSRPVT